MFVVINMKRKKQKNYKINTTTDVEYMTVIKIAIGVLKKIIKS